METIEKIELYLEGNLNAEESVLFEQEIQTNPELQAEIDTYRDIISGIRLGGEKDFMKIIHQWEKEIVAKEVNNETETGGTTADQKVIPLAAPKKSGMKWIVRIASAACVLLLIGIGYQQLFNTVTPQQLYENHFEVYNSALGGRDTENTDLTRAMTYYDKKEYANAYPLFKKILDNNPDSIILNLYAGVTCMSIDKAAEATQYLENVINSHNPNFTESAEWYLAILPLKSGDKTLAKERLTIIRNKSGHQYREKAKHIFRKLH